MSGPPKEAAVVVGAGKFDLELGEEALKVSNDESRPYKFTNLL